MRRADAAMILPPQVRARVQAGELVPTPPDPDESTQETPQEARGRVETLAVARRAAWTRRVPRRYAAASLGGLTTGQDPRGAVSSWWESGAAGLVLLSDQPGVGKTHAAYAVGHQACGLGAWVEGWTAEEMFEALRPDVAAGDRAVTWDRLKSCDLLVLDDLGQEYDTDWTRAKMQALVEARLRGDRRLVVTTNLTSGAALSKRYTPAFLDRLNDDARVVKVTGESRRKAAAW